MKSAAPGDPWRREERSRDLPEDFTVSKLDAVLLVRIARFSIQNNRSCSRPLLEAAGMQELSQSKLTRRNHIRCFKEGLSEQ